jgi:hypothetical protein
VNIEAMATKETRRKGSLGMISGTKSMVKEEEIRETRGFTEIIEGTRDIRINITTTLLRILTKRTSDVMAAVIMDTSDQIAPKGGRPMTTGRIMQEKTTARGINPLKVLLMFTFALNHYLLLLFITVGL